MSVSVMTVADRDASPATRPATAGQRGRALWFSLALILGTVSLMPVAAVLWPRIPAFIPAYQTAVILTHGIAAFLVFGHFLGSRCPALLWLGCGCLYTALILIAQFLSFPGMFAPGGLLPGGAQTTIWLWAMWHLGPVVGMTLYAFSEWRRPGERVANPRRAAARGVGLLLLALAASLAMVTVFHDRLPILDIDGDFRRITPSGIGPALEVVTILALLLLWRATGFRTVLQLWVAVTLVALLCDNAITMAGGSRMSVGWYVGRMCALVSSAVLLFGYLREINRVYLKMAAHAEDLRAQVIERGAKLDRARLDHLTRLPARALFLELAEALRVEGVADGQALGVLFIDLDGFKRVNDTLGHQRGDAVLVAAAQALRSVLRERDVAGRLGGDEFAVCLVAPPDVIEAVAVAIATRVIAAVGEIGNGIGCSIGVAPCALVSPDLDRALRQADEAMYAAKRAGKNRYAVFGAPKLGGTARAVSGLAACPASV